MPSGCQGDGFTIITSTLSRMAKRCLNVYEYALGEPASRIIPKPRRYEVNEPLPINFGRPWEQSDVILKPHNTYNEVLYANKITLAIHSLNFRALFFGKSIKNDKLEIVTVAVCLSEMCEILKIIHFPDIKSAEDQLPYPSIQLAKLFEAAEKLEIATVCDHCEKKFARLSISEKIDVLLSMEKKMVIKVMNRMKDEDFLACLKTGRMTDRIFPEADVNSMIHSFEKEMRQKALL